MRWHRFVVGIAAAAVLAAAPVAGAATNASEVPGACPAPVVRLSEIARYNLAAPGPESAPAGRGNGAEQTIGVTVPTGPLAVFGAPSTVILGRAAAGTEFRGVVRDVVAVDARGDGSGWKLTATVTGAPAAFAAARFVVCVQNVDATAESTAGIDATNAASARPGEPLTLLRIAPGSGDGAFALTFAVAADATTRVEHIAAHITFAITPTTRRVTEVATG